MVYRQNRPEQPTYSVRELPLLEGEHIEERFAPYDGLLNETPYKGQLLVLTNQRVITFIDDDGHKETFLAPLEELRGVSVRSNSKGFKNLSQGLFLIVGGVLAYFIVGYILDSVAIAAALGAAILSVGVLFVARYFFWEQEGSITFQGGNWELRFPYKSNMASDGVYKLVNRFFQLKLTPNSSTPQPIEPEPELPPAQPVEQTREYPYGPPFAAPPREPYDDV